jgi:hypothetical protein
MQISKRDWTFIAAIVALLGFLLLRSGDEKARPIPYNDTHRNVYESIHTGGSRSDAERRCTTCHGTASTPLTKQHPPKEQCLLCHKLSKIKK